MVEPTRLSPGLVRVSTISQVGGLGVKRALGAGAPGITSVFLVCFPIRWGIYSSLWTTVESSIPWCLFISWETSSSSLGERAGVGVGGRGRLTLWISSVKALLERKPGK